MRHSWMQIYDPKKYTLHDVCKKCGTSRYILAVVGIKFPRELRSYITPDGIRFTGFAPDCVPGPGGDPILFNLKSFEEDSWYQIYRYERIEEASRSSEQQVHTREL